LPRKKFRKPTVALNSCFQMSEMPMTPATLGMKKTARKNLTPGILVLSSCARNSAGTTASGTPAA
jgi:hypothetical protein